MPSPDTEAMALAKRVIEAWGEENSHVAILARALLATAAERDALREALEDVLQFETPSSNDGSEWRAAKATAFNRARAAIAAYQKATEDSAALSPEVK